MDYREALAWLDTHINLEANAGRPQGASLERMRHLAKILGDPHQTFSAIHITGTNGKGSVARMSTRLLMAHGLRTGTYTSPHLERINERIAVDLEPLTDVELAEAFSAVAAVEDLLDGAPSHFEILTAAGFLHFASAAVEAAAVEVGVLGRYDCTNIVDAEVAVLTRVARDHTDASPGWKRSIAEEKVGIVKPASTFVLGEDDPELAPIFAGVECSKLWQVGVDFGVTENRVALGGRVVDIWTPGGRYEELYLPVHGAHQGENAACAVAAVEAFFDRPLDDSVVAEAFAGLTIPGRLETVATSPLVILDCAHNPDGAVSLARALRDSFEVAGSRYLVLGTLRQQDVVEMLSAIDVSSFDIVFACTPPSPRARPAWELAAAVEGAGVSAEVVADPVEAVERAVLLAGDEDLVVVAGSIYVTGAVRAAYSRQAARLAARGDHR